MNFFKKLLEISQEATVLRIFISHSESSKEAASLIHTPNTQDVLKKIFGKSLIKLAFPENF